MDSVYCASRASPTPSVPVAAGDRMSRGNDVVMPPPRVQDPRGKWEKGKLTGFVNSVAGPKRSCLQVLAADDGAALVVFGQEDVLWLAADRASCEMRRGRGESAECAAPRRPPSTGNYSAFPTSDNSVGSCWIWGSASGSPQATHSFPNHGYSACSLGASVLSSAGELQVGSY